MKDTILLTEFVDYLKEEKQKALVRAYLKNFNIEDIDAELSKLTSGDTCET